MLEANCGKRYFRLGFYYHLFRTITFVNLVVSGVPSNKHGSLVSALGAVKYWQNKRRQRGRGGGAINQRRDEKRAAVTSSPSVPCSFTVQTQSNKVFREKRQK